MPGTVALIDPAAFELAAKTVGVLVSVAASIGLCLRGRNKLEPPEEDLPGAVGQLSTLLTAVALALILTHWMDSSHNRQVLTLTIASTTGCLAAFFIYVYLIGVHAYALNGKTRIGGFRLQAPLPSNTALTDHLQALGDPDKVWTPRSRAAMKTCFSVAYLSFTVLGSVALVSAAGLQAHPLAVQITSPSDQAVIDDQPQPVAGIAINLSEHASLWILVYSWDSKTYCPQQRVDIATNGRWTAPMRIGLTYDSGGKKFDLIAVVADRAATESFDNYIREEATSETYPGMKLPNGAQILDRITLIRR